MLIVSQLLVLKFVYRANQKSRLIMTPESENV